MTVEHLFINSWTNDINDSLDTTAISVLKRRRGEDEKKTKEILPLSSNKHVKARLNNKTHVAKETVTDHAHKLHCILYRR